VNILFVCTGNTCRSPMAEGYLRHLAEAVRRADIGVLSAGVMALPGQGASAYAVTAAAELGADISSHRSRQLTKELIEASDWVLTLAASHREMIVSSFPEYEEKVKTLSEFAGLEGDIADPFGGSEAEYRQAAAGIKERVDLVWKKIEA
jgi:Protein-tyrosine-phosphatase